MNEIWQAHPEFPCYDISNMGRVRSWHNGKHGWRTEPKLLNFKVGSNGYLSGSLSYQGKKRSCSVHTMVLETFCGPKPEGWEVRHINGDRTDNRLENLAWGTAKQNAADKKLHGTENLGERNGMAKLTADQVSEARILRKTGMKVQTLADHYGVSIGTMSTALRGVTWGHLEVVR